MMPIPREQRLELPAEQLEELRELHDDTTEFVRAVTNAFEQRTPLPEADAQSTSHTLTRKVRSLRNRHLDRMTEHPVDPRVTLIYAGLLTDYRRIRAHATSVHEATTEQVTMAG